VAGGGVAERADGGGLGSWTSAHGRVVHHLHGQPPNIHHHVSVAAVAGHSRGGARRGILSFCSTQGGGGAAPRNSPPPPQLPAGVFLVGDGATGGVVGPADQDAREEEADADPPDGRHHRDLREIGASPSQPPCMCGGGTSMAMAAAGRPHRSDGAQGVLRLPAAAAARPGGGRRTAARRRHRRRCCGHPSRRCRRR